MTADQYLSEIEQRLRKHFSASRDGYKLPDQDRHRLEGFMQGAVFMGFATSQQLADLMERVHFSVFGKTIAERRESSASLWQQATIDYNHYDQPAYERKGT
ncbi:hypothetical protein [Halopseudomonas aestusnigri]|jgi:hypothetical protein|uniref:hypothetical protein n=1 Tax=Halopseudomonas aestusnigri TaxID=857252 RepID=UPI000E896888|nr:hypothetical protein YSKK_29620 [Halopseudomonas aestusnigri]HBT57277.1 hypothetical protein [Pseudomonas sp.]HCP03244.1 hypothetical protein [Pseudomonas sp.]|tara:strand:+ start:2481 stop:2783 length:303 start_codon:yes stop_codon:yes gene_type:complete